MKESTIYRIANTLFLGLCVSYILANVIYFRPKDISEAHNAGYAKAMSQVEKATLKCIKDHPMTLGKSEHVVMHDQGCEAIRVFWLAHHEYDGYDSPDYILSKDDTAAK